MPTCHFFLIPYLPPGSVAPAFPALSVFHVAALGAACVPGWPVLPCAGTSASSLPLCLLGCCLFEPCRCFRLLHPTRPVPPETLGSSVLGQWGECGFPALCSACSFPCLSCAAFLAPMRRILSQTCGGGWVVGGSLGPMLWRGRVCTCWCDCVCVHRRLRGGGGSHTGQRAWQLQSHVGTRMWHTHTPFCSSVGTDGLREASALALGSPASSKWGALGSGLPACLEKEHSALLVLSKLWGCRGPPLTLISLPLPQCVCVRVHVCVAGGLGVSWFHQNCVWLYILLPPAKIRRPDGAGWG